MAKISGSQYSWSGNKSLSERKKKKQEDAGSAARKTSGSSVSATRNYKNLSGSQYRVGNQYSNQSRSSSSDRKNSSAERYNTYRTNQTYKNNSRRNMSGSQYSITSNQRRVSDDRQAQQERYNQRSLAQRTKAKPTNSLVDSASARYGTGKQEDITLKNTLAGIASGAVGGASKYDPKTDTGKVVKSTLKDIGYSHLKTFEDMAGGRGSYHFLESPERMEQEQQAHEQRYKKISAGQAEAQKELQDVKEGATGLKKTWLDAVESGTGMLTDRALGPAWAYSMFSRTYGSVRGTAEAQGATANEDRINAILQAGKEVATEYLFRGVGLARGLSGSRSLSLGDRIASAATRNLTGRKADIVGGLLRYGSGIAEENAEEAIAWGVEPFLEELSYKRNVRKRQAQESLQAESNELRSMITSPQEAEAIAAYLGSDDFIEKNTQTYMDNGMPEAEARALAESMRDYLTASLTGDTETMEAIDDDIIRSAAGGMDRKAWDVNELIDTFAATTLLTGLTGAPGAVQTQAVGSQVKQEYGNDGLRALANTVMYSSGDNEMSVKAQEMRDRLDSGKEITATQAYDLAQGFQQMVSEDSQRQRDATAAAQEQIRSENLAAPAITQNGQTAYGEITGVRTNSFKRSASDTIEILQDDRAKEQNADTQNESYQLERRSELENGAQAIANFRTGVFTISDANTIVSSETIKEAFKEETGIDLNQYNVLDKKGNLDYGKTAAKMKDALFAQAANNMVESAKLETDNWRDNVKGQVVTDSMRSVGKNGQDALENILKDFDERDAVTYMNTVNAATSLWSAGRNMGIEWGDVRNDAVRAFPSVDESILERMYNMGLEDRALAESKAVGRQTEIGKVIESGEESTNKDLGTVTVQDGLQVKGSTIEMFRILAKNMNIQIQLVDHIGTGENASRIRGAYVDGVMYLNVNADNLGYVFMHEITHHMRIYAPTEYQALAEAVREKWYKTNPAQMAARIAEVQSLYANAEGQTLSEEEALEEIICDAAHEFLTDKDFADRVSEDNPSLAKQILNGIREALRALRRIFVVRTNAEARQNDALFSQLGMLKEAEELWLNAYTAAVRNRAISGLIKAEMDRNNNENVQDRFSLNKNVERVRDLVAVHNLKADDMRNAFKLGGFPMPSIAVIKSNMGHDMYGDISLMFHSNTIDPKRNRANNIFGGDAYTPTFPQIYYKADSAVSKKLVDMYYNMSKSLGYDEMRPLYPYTVTIDSTLDSAGGESGLIDRAKNDYSLMRLYLRMNNKDVEDVTITTSTTLSDGEVQTYDFLIKELGKDLIAESTAPSGTNGLEHFRSWREANADKLDAAYEKLCRDVFGFDEATIAQVMSDEKGKRQSISKLIQQTKKYIKNGKTTTSSKVDYAATDRAVKEAADANGYDSWVEDLFKGIEEKSGIRNTRDVFTPSGNRRSWDSLHNPVTLDNVVDSMKRELDAGGNTLFGANPAAAAQKKYTSLDDVRADEDRLQQLEEEEYEALRSEATAKLSKVAYDIYNNSPAVHSEFEMFGAIDVGSDIAEILNKTRARNGIKSMLERNYSYTVSEKIMDDLMDAIDSIANIPTGYFEAKPKRAVELSEVQAAIIPNNLDSDVAEALKNRGIKTFEYDPNVEGDRTKVLNNVAEERNLRFSLSSDVEQRDADYMAAVESGDMKTAQRMVDEAAKAAGYTSPKLYHGTNAFGFTEIDTRKTNDRISFFATDSESTAGTYSGTSTVRNINNDSESSVGMYQLYANTDGFLELDAKNAQSNHIDLGSIERDYNYYINKKSWYSYATAKQIARYAKSNGYPGIVIKNVIDTATPESRVDTAASNVYVFFNPKAQVKSADPVTYDDSGNVISLSERFNESNTDIRYSLTHVEPVVPSSSLWKPSANFADVKKAHPTLFEQDTDQAEQSKENDKRHLTQVKNTVSTYNKIYDMLGEDFNGTILDASSGLGEGTRSGRENYGFDVEDIEPYPAEEYEPMYKDYSTLNKQYDVIISNAVLNVLTQDDRDSMVYHIGKLLKPGGKAFINVRGDDVKNAKSKIAIDESNMEYFIPKTSKSGYYQKGFTPKELKAYLEDALGSNFDVEISKKFGKASAIVTKHADNRYSIAAEDSDGNTLSEGQREFFKDSKAVDGNGRLQVVYHSTDEGGYSIFDPSYSDDKRSLFFSSDILVALTYGTSVNKIKTDELPVVKGNYKSIYDYDKEINSVYLEQNREFIGHQDADVEYTLVKILDKPNRWGDKYELLDNEEVRKIFGYNAYGIFTIDKWDQAKGNESWADSIGVEVTINDGGRSWKIYGETPEELYRNLEDDLRKRARKYNLKGFYSCYLNLVNPLIVDAHGAKWNSIPFEGDKYNTRGLARKAEISGNDGVIIRNCIDIGGKSPYAGENAASDIYIAFKSNQVKDVDNKNPTDSIDIRFALSTDAEKQTYANENVEDMDLMELTDPILEEGRRRMARTKDEFFANCRLQWNEKWLTDGKVLKPESIKKSVRSVIMGAMSNSDTNRKYKTELVDYTIDEAMKAYRAMKSKKFDEAYDILWKAAEHMTENVEFYHDDPDFEYYKEIRDYFRTLRLTVPDEYKADIDYPAYKKNTFGRIRIVAEGGLHIDEIWEELSTKWPEWFNPEVADPAQMLLDVQDALERAKPYKIAYSSEEAAELTGQIADDLYKIVYDGESYQSVADQYKQRYDEKVKALKQRHAEAMQEAREQAKKEKRAAVKEAREKQVAKQKERTGHAKYFGRIYKNYRKLSRMLIDPTQNHHIPEQFRIVLAETLSVFDLQTERSKSLEEQRGYPAKKTLQLHRIRAELMKIASEDGSEYLEADTSLFEQMDELANRVDGQTIDALTSEDLKIIDNMLRYIIHGINNWDKIRINGQKMQAAQFGDNTIAAMQDRINQFGMRKVYGGVRGIADNLVNEGETTPIYFFERLDPNGTGIGAMYKELRRGEDKYIQNMNVIKSFVRENFEQYWKKGKPGSGELQKWRSAESSKTFNFTSGPVTLTQAQMMSLYLYRKREQAMQHITGNGIVIAPVTIGQKLSDKIKGHTEETISKKLSAADLDTIIGELSDEQRALADKLQAFLNNEMSAWGNETSMELYGYKKFRETDYFPIRSSNEVLSKDINKAGSAQEKIKNLGFTKDLVKGANNAIVIDDVFTVWADHCNKMALYNAMSVPISDFMRVYNYKQTSEDGSTTTVQQMIGQAFTRRANSYIMKFLDDVNQNTKTREDAVDAVIKKSLANYKKASIGANVRVALQQPTAIFRALAVLDPKWFAGVKPSRRNTAEMFEHCPIALWKSWGHYEMDLGRDIDSIIMNEDWSRWDVVTMGAYGALDNMTWGMIWQAVKREVKANNPNVAEGSEEFWRLCNERASEVFDKTQVVDSLFHRSDTMRAKGTLTKMMTSFMAEPTLTYNVFRNSAVNAYEQLRIGDYAGAAKTFGRMSTVLILNAAAVSASAAIADVLRGKDPDSLLKKLIMGDDDDDDKQRTAADLWLANFFANFSDNANMLNNIYVIKDIWSLMDGWGTSNMALEGWETLFTGISQFKKKITDGSNKTWPEILTKIGSGIGYITGVPVKTMFRDVPAVLKLFGITLDVSAADGTEEADKEDPAIKALLIGGGIGSLTSTKKASGASKNGNGGDNSAKSSKKTSNGGDKNGNDGDNSAEEEKPVDYEKLRSKAIEKAEGLSGREKDDKIWDTISEGYTKHLENNDWSHIQKMRDITIEAGGDPNKFDERITDACHSMYKRTINTDSAMESIPGQIMMREYMREHGVSDEEISEMCYKSNTAKDLKAALRIGDDKLIYAELSTLIVAGLSYEDFCKLYEYRNYGAKKYDGKYKDLMKSSGTYVWPAQGTITSEFGPRTAPTAGASSYHQGIDIGASMGSRVDAADGGQVIYAGYNGGYGNQVVIRHDDGTETYYSHLYGYNVKPGDVIAQGQQIGQVGSTGTSTGPHLDFRVKVNGEFVNPIDYLSA